jgi:hypothetical protein
VLLDHRLFVACDSEPQEEEATTWTADTIALTLDFTLHFTSLYGLPSQES